MIIKALAVTAAASVCTTTLCAAQAADSITPQVVEGDILVAPPMKDDFHREAISNQGFSSTFSKRGLGLNDTLRLWPNGIIPYQMHDNLSQMSREAIAAAVEHWNAVSRISLLERSDSRVAGASDYIEFVDGPSCASWVGRNGSVQEIWVNEICNRGSMIHEIGHAIGLLHEHTRSDRDQFIRINWENIQTGKEYNFEITNGGVVDQGSYDYASIMHYGEYFFTANSEPTIEPIQNTGGAVIGQREAASSGDIAAVDRMYQTDLSVVAADASSNGATEVIFQVTNLGVNGAHDIVLDIPSRALDVATTSADAWNCSTALDFEGIRCNLWTLPGSATSQVTVSFEESLIGSEFSATISSRTQDTDASNNLVSSLSSEDAIPDLQSAVGSPAQANSASGTNTGGGGLLGLLSLFTLMLNITRRRSFMEEKQREKHSRNTSDSGE